MHPESKKADFIAYRSRNWSLKRISNQIGVGLRTLVDWNREFDDAIHMTRHLNADVHFQNLVEARQKDLELIASRQHAIDKELAERDLGDVATDKLIRLAILSREELLQARSDNETLAQRRYFIPDFLPVPRQMENASSSETKAVQPPASPESVQTDSTPSAPESTADSQISTQADPDGAEKAHEERKTSAEMAQL